MDQILRGKEPSEVIPFGWEDPVLYYPVRHHSPACAWHLQRVIQRYRPDCILIEGPEDAGPLLPLLADPLTQAPVALYCSYRDDARLLETPEERDDDPAAPVGTYACYYPFLDQSPELAAIRAAAALGVPAQFIDLPYAENLLATRAGRALRQEGRPENYLNDHYLWQNAFWQRVCEKTGMRSFEEFWEKYYETAGFAMSDEAFVRQMNAWCVLARQATPQEEMEADGCLAREARMAVRIAAAAARYQRVLVVAGGFHLWGLMHPRPEQTRPAVPADSQAVYPVRFSFEAADALSGYASGMPAPAFYTAVWQAAQAAPADAFDPAALWDETVLGFLVKCGRRLRREGEVLSAFDEMCAMQQARGLAALRDKKAPGLYEMQDAVLSSFVKGEANLSGCQPLRVLRQLTTGNGVGQLAPNSLVPPLVQDFQAQCRRYRIRSDKTSLQELTLEIFAKPAHRGASRFLYQTEFLGCGFARRTKGPDLRRNKDKNLIRESWEYRWTASVEAALVERSVAGSTVREACARELRQRMAGAGRAGEGADLLLQGFLMGIGEDAGSFARRLEELLLGDGDFSSLCQACRALASLEEWQVQYGEAGRCDAAGLLGRCFDCILQLLPAMGAADDRGAPEVQRCCLLLYQITQREAFAGMRPRLLAALEELAGQNPVQPALHGTALGLLYGAAPGWKARIDTALRGYLQGTRGMMLASAAFLQGLFYTAKDLLLVDPGFLKQVDGLLCALSDQDFDALLPELRLAFSYFVPMETDRIARQAAALHRGTAGTLRQAGISPAEYSRNEQVDAWAAARLAEEAIP